VKNLYAALRAGFIAGLAKFHHVRDQQQRRARMPDPFIGA
jgi:hypothetical protein